MKCSNVIVDLTVVDGVKKLMEATSWSIVIDIETIVSSIPFPSGHLVQVSSFIIGLFMHLMTYSVFDPS